MCMEDIRLGRQSVARHFTAVVANDGTLTVPANGRRVGLHIGGGPWTATGGMLVYIDSQDNANLIIQLTISDTTRLLRIEEYGTLVQGRFLLRNVTGTAAVLSYIEMTLLDNPANINGEVKVQSAVGRPASRESAY